jgi:hypothetical protein
MSHVHAFITVLLLHFAKAIERFLRGIINLASALEGLSELKNRQTAL